MISDIYKCIFIHIPKTAGTSIEQSLGHFKELKRGVQDHRPISDIEPLTFHDFMKSALRPELSASKKIIKKVISDNRSDIKSKYDAYFKFTFVRNSWSRVFSWYKNVMRDDHHKKRFGVSDSCSFKDFVNNHLDQFELKTQLYWITNKKGEIPMDFIGRFENLEKDFSYVADVLKIANKNLPKLVVGDGQHYSQFYDAEMKDIVFKRYRDEISFFNFEYGE